MLRSGRWVLVASGLALVACTGCGGVNRRFVIESNVPNAQVFIDNRPVGAAPAHAGFEYYGYYNIEVVNPGYERVKRRVHVRPPWYGYPPLDFLVDVFWPFHIDDARYYYIELQEAKRTDTAVLIQNAEMLRERGANLPAPEHPALPKVKAPPADALPLPDPTPLPTTPGVLPSVMP